MATLTPSPRMQFFDSNGDPLAGGKVYTYAAGTVTPLATYTDSGGGTENTNPVILDSRGQAAIWLGTSLYKFVVHNSADVLQPDGGDNIGGTATLNALTGSTGSSLVGFIQQGTGAVATTVQGQLRESVSVSNYGASPAASASVNTTAIQNAINTGASIIYFPEVGYEINNTLYIRDTYGIRLIAEPSAANTYKDATLIWTGAAAKPMMVIGNTNTATKTAYSVTIDGLSFDGANTATWGVTIGDPTNSTYNELVKYLCFSNVVITRCRTGLKHVIGSGAPDYQSHNYVNCTFNNCIDYGVWLESGNGAGINFVGCTANGNGETPTTDAYNTTGNGANFRLAGGDANFMGITTSGTPATADIKMTGNSLKINGWWSDCIGKFLEQGGTQQALYIGGVRHYNSSQTLANTPTSIDCQARITLIGCYLFGDVLCASGTTGAITSISTTFFPAGAQRATQGTYGGDIVTTYNGLCAINDTGNYGPRIITGGGAKALAAVGYNKPTHLMLGANLFAGSHFAQILGPGATDSGLSITINAGTGAMEIHSNCYVSDGSFNFKAHKIGLASRIILGGTYGSGGITILQNYFADTTTAIASNAGSWVQSMGVINGGSSGTYTEVAMAMPQLAGDPSYSSGNWWKGAIYYNTSTNKLKVNVGGGTWETITSA